MSLGYLESKKVPFNCEGLQLVWTDILVHYRFYDILRCEILADIWWKKSWWKYFDPLQKGHACALLPKLRRMGLCLHSALPPQALTAPHPLGRKGKWERYWVFRWILDFCSKSKRLLMELRSKVLLRKLIISPLKNDLFGLKKHLSAVPFQQSRSQNVPKAEEGVVSRREITGCGEYAGKRDAYSCHTRHPDAECIAPMRQQVCLSELRHTSASDAVYWMPDVWLRILRCQMYGSGCFDMPRVGYVFDVCTHTVCHKTDGI